LLVHEILTSMVSACFDAFCFIVANGWNGKLRPTARALWVHGNLKSPYPVILTHLASNAHWRRWVRSADSTLKLVPRAHSHRGFHRT
jgi:hypothetical protein